MPWFLLRTAPLDGPDNMALDAALMNRARRTGETVLRVYEWSEPTLSFGRHQRTLAEYDADALVRACIGVVRRPTGGRALLHHREVTYSVTAPVTEPLGSAYERINTLLLNALARLGVPANLARSASSAPPPSSRPCFAEPSRGEVVVNGRKLVGSAQWRDGGALLQHGSILVDDDQPVIASFTKQSLPPVPPPATLRALLGRAPTSDEVLACLLAAVRDVADSRAEHVELEPAVRDDATHLAHWYRSAAWTWRR